jgi:hypothetical protein
MVLIPGQTKLALINKWHRKPLIVDTVFFSVSSYPSIPIFLTTYTYSGHVSHLRAQSILIPPPIHHLDYRSHSCCSVQAISYVILCQVWRRDFPTGASRGSNLLATHSETEKQITAVWRNKVILCIKRLKLIHYNKVELCQSEHMCYLRNYLLSKFLLNLVLEVHIKSMSWTWFWCVPIEVTRNSNRFLAIFSKAINHIRDPQIFRKIWHKGNSILGMYQTIPLKVDNPHTPTFGS